MTQIQDSTWYTIRVRQSDHLQTEQLLGDLRKLLRGQDPAAAVGVFISQVTDQVADLYLSPAAADLAGKLLHHYFGIPSGPPPATAKHLLGSPAAIEQPPS